MFRFEHPEFLWLLAAVPLMFLLFLGGRWWAERQKTSFATDSAWQRLLAQWSIPRMWVQTALTIVGIALMTMALANPQWGTRRETVQAKAADVYIALDISTSMYARDIAPSRLERAKKFAIDLVETLRGDRIGLILFAGNAYLQMPLTSDYAAAELFIKSAHPGLASTQGTSVGEAIDLAMRAFTEEENHQKALVLITDGENHEDGALDEMEQGRAAGLVPFIVSVGTTEGAFIPVIVQGREDYKRDESGAPVKSAVNEAFMKDLANAGGGYVYSVLDADFVSKDIRDKIDLFEKREMEQRAFKDFDSYYQYFLFGGLVLLLCAWMLPLKRRGSEEMLSVQTS